MAGEYLKAVNGTFVAGMGVSLLLGINLIGVAAFVGLATFFVAVPAAMYLVHEGRIDPDGVFKAGVTFAVGSYLLATVVLFAFDALEIGEYLQPVRLAMIPAAGYVVVHRFGVVEDAITENVVTDNVKTVVGSLVAGTGLAFRVGGLPGFAVALVSVFVVTPILVYLVRVDEFDADDVFKMGLTLGIGPLLLPTLALALGWGFAVLAVVLFARKLRE
jgi:hypothetical protein